MNVNKIKKWVGILIVSILPIVIYNVFLISGWGLIWAMVGSLLLVILGIPLFSIIYKHPLLDVIEGKGMLVLTLDSTGIIHPYIAQLKPPLINVKTKKGLVSTIFDRNSVSYLKAPKIVNATAKEDAEFEILTLKIPKNKKYQYQFQFDAYPTLVYNRNLETFLSKETLGKMEMDTSIKHLVFYLKKKTEELTSVMRDFARYVIEMSKPKNPFGFVGNAWFWIIVVVAVIIFALLLMPNITSTFKNLVPMPTNPVTPKP